MHFTAFNTAAVSQPCISSKSKKMQPRAKAGKDKSQRLSVNDAASLIQGAVRKVIRDTGRSTGQSLGRIVGKPGRGAKMGKSIAARMSKLMGQGDYTTNEGELSTNSLFAGKQDRGSASFETQGGGVRIKHREFVQDIFQGPTTSTFTNASFIVNPGLAFVFPYLAQIASNFEQYKFHGLVFEFISSVSPYQTSGLGTYVMAMQYNASAPAFTSKPAMENSDYALSARLDHNGMYGVECAPQSQAQEYYYVRAPGVTTPANLTDLGVMQVAVVTPITANATLGELWVTYDCELIRPRIALERYGYAHITTTGATSASPLGTAVVKNVTYGALVGTVLGDGTVAAANQGTQISFPNASVGDIYQFTISYSGSVAATAAAYPTITPANMILSPTLYKNNTRAYLQATVNPLSYDMTSVYLYTVTGEQPVIPSLTFGVAGNFPTGTVYLDIIVQDLGNGWSISTL